VELLKLMVELIDADSGYQWNISEYLIIQSFLSVPIFIPVEPDSPKVPSPAPLFTPAPDLNLTPIHRRHHLDVSWT
jgi:hypothetical protein